MDIGDDATDNADFGSAEGTENDAGNKKNPECRNHHIAEHGGILGGLRRSKLERFNECGSLTVRGLASL